MVRMCEEMKMLPASTKGHCWETLWSYGRSRGCIFLMNLLVYDPRTYNLVLLYLWLKSYTQAMVLGTDNKT